MIDLTENFNKTYGETCLKVQGEGKNILILRNMGYTTQRMDGKRGQYQIEHRWLSEEVDPKTDNFACVQGQDWTYWQRKEILDALKPDANLFECFSLCG
tara:strand:+ start:32587 stop:32883 length:297 start_codon:yes stop_codon:yes gene_type:complete